MLDGYMVDLEYAEARDNQWRGHTNTWEGVESWTELVELVEAEAAESSMEGLVLVLAEVYEIPKGGLADIEKGPMGYIGVEDDGSIYFEPTRKRYG